MGGNLEGHDVAWLASSRKSANASVDRRITRIVWGWDSKPAWDGAWFLQHLVHSQHLHSVAVVRKNQATANNRELQTFSRPPTPNPTYPLVPMHPCLRVDEIVRVIASELVLSGGRGTSVALACCCKSLEDPVLDVLWETQTRLRPLLGSLPIDVWDEWGSPVSVPTTDFYLSLNRLVQRLLRDSRQRWNGLVSGSTPEGCEVSWNAVVHPFYLRRCFRFCNPALSVNPCFRA